MKTLGHGSYSKVKLAVDTKSNTKYAIKIINRKLLEKKNKGFQRSNSGNVQVSNLLQDSMREIAILKKKDNSF